MLATRGDRKNQSIECVLTPTFSSLDESLHLLQHFLTIRLNEYTTSLNCSEITLDLAILGLQDDGGEQALALSRPQTLVYPLRLYRSQIFLGPLYNPAAPDSPCPHCLERRWFANLPQGEQKAFMERQATTVFGHNPRLTAFALEALWQLLATLLQRVEQEARPQNGAYSFYTLDLASLQVTRAYLIQDALCPVCVTLEPDTSELATLQLVSRPKPQVDQYRLQKATDYHFSLAGLVNPVAGMLGRDHTTNPVNVLVPVSGTFQVREKYHVREAWWRGHGHTEQQGLYLGLLEGIERYAGHIPHHKQTTIFESYAHLAPDALDPRTCGLYQPAFYPKNAPFYAPFTPERVMPWIWGYSFRQRRPLLVPEQLVYYVNYRSEYPSMVQDCSSGCAIGSCLEEALFHALLELIERDTFLLSWYARLAPPRIEPRSCQNLETLFILEAVEKSGYDLYFFDTRLDTPIPSVMGVARRKEPGPGNFMLSAGCSFDPEDAIHKTLCEIASHVFSFPEITARRMDEIRAMAQDFSLVKGLSECGLLFGLPEMAHYADFLFQNPLTRTLAETYHQWNTTRPRHDDLLDDLSFCMETLFQLGLDVIVVDQTSREQRASGLTTVCALVPGLLPMDFGWERDRVLDLPRLRTVPRTAGYRQTDFQPDAQKIVPHPFP